MTQKTYSQMLPETEMGEYSVLELSNSLDDLQRKCSQVNEIIQKEIEILENEKQKISNIDLSLLLDISSKHINIYKALNNDSTNIDENIHNIFMNYTFVLNLLKKQINHLIKIMLEIKENVNSKCDLLNTFIEDIETSKIQKVGCSNMKQLIEADKLLVDDFDIINELSTYIVNGNQFQAEEGSNDDLVMCLVLFSWATDQRYFKELTDQDIRKRMYADNQDRIEQDMTPFGFKIDGLEDENIGEMVDDYGTRWSPVVRDKDTDW